MHGVCQFKGPDNSGPFLFPIMKGSGKMTYSTSLSSVEHKDDEFQSFSNF